MVAIHIRTKTLGLPAGRHGNGGQDIVAAPAARHVKLPRNGVILVRARKILDLSNTICGVKRYGRYQTGCDKKQALERIIFQAGISFG